MIRTLKLCLLWLMMAAIPLQGMASVLQQTCGVNQSRPAVKQVDKKSSLHKFRLAHKRGDMTKQKQDGKHAVQHDSSTCSICFDCCVGGSAPPVSAMDRVQHDLNSPHLPSLSLLFGGFIPDGIERPPRPHIA